MRYVGQAFGLSLPPCRRRRAFRIHFTPQFGSGVLKAPNPIIKLALAGPFLSRLAYQPGGGLL